MLFVLLLLVWAFWGELDIVVTARGKVVADGYTKIVQSPLPGAVRAIRAQEGDTVKIGTVLLELDGRADNADLGAVRDKLAKARVELARLESEYTGKPAEYPATQVKDQEILAQETLRRARDTVFSGRKSEARALLESKRRALSAGEQALASGRERLRISVEKEQRARPYVDIAMPRFQYLQIQDDLTALDGTVRVQEQSNERLRAEVDQSQRSLALLDSERNASLLAEISERRLYISQTESDLVRAERRSSDNEIRSPVDGYVQKIYATSIGATVAFNEAVASLVPSDSELLVEAFLPSDQKGFVRIGQNVDIKVDAYPYQKHGKLKGRLAWISPDAEEWSGGTKGFMPESQALKSLTNSDAGLFYRIKVTLERGSSTFSISPGMTVSVDVFTDKRRVIDFFLFPVSRAVDEALRIR